LWTALRPRALCGTSAHACGDPRDVAAAAVGVLAEDGHEGRVPTLTGPGPISALEQRERLGRLRGSP
jgi:uncharacterized protein YbjT (DUF2867 family)